MGHYYAVSRAAPQDTVLVTRLGPVKHDKGTSAAVHEPLRKEVTDAVFPLHPIHRS